MQNTIKQGVPPKSDIPLIKKALKEKDASLQILNAKGDILASIKCLKKKHVTYPLEIISRKIEQDKYDSTATVFHDSKKKISWIFYTSNNYHSITDESIIRKAG